MNSNKPSPQQQIELWNALQDWISQYPDGRLVLNNFQSNPQQGFDALISWIKNNKVNVPPQLATYVTGGNIDQLNNVIAGIVNYQTTQRIIQPVSEPPVFSCGALVLALLVIGFIAGPLSAGIFWITLPMASGFSGPTGGSFGITLIVILSVLGAVLYALYEVFRRMFR